MSSPNPSTSTVNLSNLAAALPHTPTTQPEPPRSEDPLKVYWKERAKFVKHLDRHHDKYLKKSKADLDKAKGIKRPKPLAPLQVVAPKKDDIVSPVTSGTDSESGSATGSLSDSASGTSEDMIGKNLVNVTKKAVATPSVASSSRSFATTAPTLKVKKVRNPDAMETAEAARVLRALEISNPAATAYSITLSIRDKSAKKTHQSLRGRCFLPVDPRRTTDTVLVLTEPNTPSRALAEAANVQYVGGDELFEPLLNGEIVPTKVLCTPGMLPNVTRTLGRFLGQKGLMPTVKRGGVGEGEELVQRIREARGAMDWMSTKEGLITTPIARMHFGIPEVVANIKELTNSVRSAAAANAPEEVSNEAVVSRRNTTKKRAPAIKMAFLSSANGPAIELRDA